MPDSRKSTPFFFIAAPRVLQENKRTEREISVYTSECVCACACVCVRERDRGRVKKLRVEETDGRRVMSVCCVNEENSPKIKLENVYVRESCDCKKEKKKVGRKQNREQETDIS
ncbi:hypothetical protein VTP01DRAFT_9925 [Rhizomucor pusillus]|uniref:uncharacterized protein n=1 Tax=Rhizomucor pusillus TaxID=4840 RepID=UPI003742A60A